MFRYQSIILSRYGINSHHISPIGIHPDFPFAHLYRIEIANMPEEVLCFLWYICSIYTIGIAFDIPWLYHYVNAQQGQKGCLSIFLTWFAPLSDWSGKLRRSAKAISLPYKKLKGKGNLNPFFNPHTIYFFHRPVQVNPKSGKVHTLPTLIHHNDHYRGVRPDFSLSDNKIYEDFQAHAFRLNNIRQTFLVPFIPNWLYYPIDYQMSLDEDLQFYMEKTETSKASTTPVVPKWSKQDEPPEYFQDAQDPNEDEDEDTMNIDEIATRFGINVNSVSHIDYEEPEPEYKCPDDHYGCCEEHILEFEMDH